MAGKRLLEETGTTQAGCYKTSAVLYCDFSVYCGTWGMLRWALELLSLCPPAPSAFWCISHLPSIEASCVGVFTAFRILEKLLDVLRCVLQVVITFNLLFFGFREQLFFYLNGSNNVEFGGNLLFYKTDVLKNCLHLDAFISAIQQALQGLISRKTEEMKPGINERLIKYSLSV